MRSGELRLFGLRLDGNDARNETGDVAGSGKKDRADQDNRGQESSEKTDSEGGACNLLKTGILNHKAGQLSKSV